MGPCVPLVFVQSKTQCEWSQHHCGLLIPRFSERHTIKGMRKSVTDQDIQCPLEFAQMKGHIYLYTQEYINHI